MILYITDRNGAVLTEYSHFFNDKHHRELEAGASTFNFSVKKANEDTSVLKSGNGVILRDDAGRDWFFTILSIEETQYQVSVESEDASIELLNRMMDELPNTGAHPFSYYVNQIIGKTPWRLNVDQTQGKERSLTYTGQDTGLGRLLSIAKGFDNVELSFHVRLAGMQIADYYIDAVTRIGSDRSTDIQIDYQNELNNMTRSESRAKFVTAMRGIGSVIQQEGAEQQQPEQHIDFSSIEYDDGQFRSPKGDPWIYADAANRAFNEQYSYIEGLYSFDTDSPQELFNRTLSQLKIYSEPSVTYEADVKKIDPTLDLGDTVRIIDHAFPNLYLSARVSQLDKSYTDPSSNAVKFSNYEVLTSNLDERIAFAVSKLPSQARYVWIRYADDAQGSNMSASPAGKSYIAMKSNQTSAVMSDNPADYAGLWVKIVGDDGAPGANGLNGADAHLHIAWADNVTGTQGFTTSGSAAVGKPYMGTYSDNQSDQSTNPAKYAWVYTRGATGAPGSDNVPVITVGTDFPTSPAPKSGDVFWHKDDKGNVDGFFIYDASAQKWNPNSIQQSLLIINTLDSVTINSGTINSPDINVPYDYTEADVRHVGTMKINNGRITIDDYVNKNVANKEQHTVTRFLPTGYEVRMADQSAMPRSNPDTNPWAYASVTPQSVQLNAMPTGNSDPAFMTTVNLSQGRVGVSDRWENMMMDSRYLKYIQKAEFGGSAITIDMLDLARNARFILPGYTAENADWSVIDRPRAIVVPLIGSAGHGLVYMRTVMNCRNDQPAWSMWTCLHGINGLPNPRWDDYNSAWGWARSDTETIVRAGFDGARMWTDTKRNTMAGDREYFFVYLY